MNIQSCRVLSQDTGACAPSHEDFLKDMILVYRTSAVKSSGYSCCGRRSGTPGIRRFLRCGSRRGGPAGSLPAHLLNGVFLHLRDSLTHNSCSPRWGTSSATSVPLRQWSCSLYWAPALPAALLIRKNLFRNCGGCLTCGRKFFHVCRGSEMIYDGCTLLAQNKSLSGTKVHMNWYKNIPR